MAEALKPRLLRIAGLGCATVLVLVLGLAGWIALQLRAMNRPVVVDGVHPFRSAARKERYLAHYDERARGWPVPSTTRSVETSWGRTFVRISGPADGPPLVLLPGANATGLMFEPNVAAWSERFRVFAIDNVFDYGRSVYVRNLETPGDFVDWLDELLVRLGLRDGVNLLGVSYGGWIAAEYGLEHPERLHALVLVAPAATVAQFSLDFIKRGVLCLIPHPYFVKSMVRWALADAADGNPEQRRWAEEAADNAWLGLRSFRLRQMVHPRVFGDAELASFAVPVLFVLGEHEVIYEISAVQAIDRLHRVAPAIATELFPGCGHDVTIVRAEAFNRQVTGFLAVRDDAGPAPEG